MISLNEHFHGVKELVVFFQPLMGSCHAIVIIVVVGHLSIRLLHLSQNIRHYHVLFLFLVDSQSGFRLFVCNCTLYFGVGIFLDHFYILTYITLILLAYAPLVSMYVVQNDVLAWVGLIAPKNKGKQQALLDIDISQNYISDVDSGLSGTSSLRVEGVEHASWASSVRLLLLLRAQVYRPPHRFDHGYVFINNVGYDAVSLLPRVCLDVDALQWSLHVNIPESDVPDAVGALVRRY